MRSNNGQSGSLAPVYRGQHASDHASVHGRYEWIWMNDCPKYYDNGGKVKKYGSVWKQEKKFM